MPPTISSPLRMLILSPQDTLLPEFLRGITTFEKPQQSTFTDNYYSPDAAHHQISTPYYNASIPIWRDDLPTTSPTLSSWKSEWTASEAAEVVRAVGAWVVCFKKPRNVQEHEGIQQSLKAVAEVVAHHNGAYGVGEPLLLAVGMKQSISPSLEVGKDEWEDVCRENGAWEWIDGERSGEERRKGVMEVQTNEFGERVGVARLREALEAHEWEGESADGLEGGLDLKGEGKYGFDAEAAQMEREMMGLKLAMNGDDGEEVIGVEDDVGDDGVQELENMMLKMQAVRDMGADMPEAERKRFADKALKDVIKTL